MSEFVIGRSNIAVTVFVPWDCSNHCAFCSSKIEYQRKDGKTLDEKMELIIKTIKKFNKTNINEVVFTGGEPLADITKLQKLIDVVSKTKKIYINTTFPCVNRFQASKIATFINDNDKIKGISISRHQTTFNDDEKMFSKNILKDRWLSLIKKPVRINCVVNDSTNYEAFIRRFENAPDNVLINFRANYLNITQNNLVSFHEKGISELFKINKLEYLDTSGCSVCNTNKFKYNYTDGNKRYILYHRGINLSSIQLNSVCIVNDIIIKQTGDWYYDWDNKDTDKDNLYKKLLKEYVDNDCEKEKYSRELYYEELLMLTGNMTDKLKDFIDDYLNGLDNEDEFYYELDAKEREEALTVINTVKKMINPKCKRIKTKSKEKAILGIAGYSKGNGQFQKSKIIGTCGSSINSSCGIS